MGPQKLAPTKEALSFKEYSAGRKLNGLRRSACKLFQSAQVVTVVQKVEVEVESQRLMIRKDRKVHADLGTHIQKCFHWFCGIFFKIIVDSLVVLFEGKYTENSCITH